MTTIPPLTISNLNTFHPYGLEALQDKATYLAFRDAWRREYKARSLYRRYETTAHRATGGTPHKVAASELAAKRSIETPCTQENKVGYVYWETPSGKQVDGSKAVLNWLLWLRRESKRQAQLGYLRAKNAQNVTASP